MDKRPGDEQHAALVAEGIHKSFGQGDERVTVLRGVDLRIEPGDSLAIVGASGIGKSTLLHILGTLERPDAGSLRFGSRPLLSMADAELAAFRNRHIGFVFQFHHLLPEFSALENVMLPELIAGCDKKRAARRARQVLERVGLADKARRNVNDLSGGEQQRVALARALVRGPSLLMADEPTGNLDAGTSGRIHHLLLDLNRDLKMALVVVTHNMELADLMQRKATLKQGRLVFLEKDQPS